ncbi:uncharacterized protein LOC105398830 [Plutella xylostella]|uniref:uncharacterized protein LOC105398830 n=1 Tax=Plutella xylostella TaxID=51655 RepID=UPI0020323183|nr:uncharacterized protein LOC105398830 [Plutella xylostella]
MASATAVVIVRRARGGAAENAARSALIRDGFSQLTGAAFLSFMFSELSLQVVVLIGAVLFIFLHAPLWALLSVPVVVAAVVYVCVVVTHQALADRHTQMMLKEEEGLVAELRAPLGASPRDVTLRVVTEPQELTGDAAGMYPQLIGTASISEWLGAGPRSAARLHALAVSKRWCNLGIGSALAAAAARRALVTGKYTVEAAASELQASAQHMFYKRGWSSRGSYHRRLVGSALTLVITQYGKDLDMA